jgi:hypothetical protein
MELSPERIRAVRLQIQEKTQAQPRITTVERRRHIERDEFFEDFARASRPVIIENATATWKSKDWTPQSLRTDWGSLPIQVRARHFPGRDPRTLGLRDCTLAEYLDDIAAYEQKHDDKEPRPYMANQAPPAEWASFIESPAYYTTPYVTRFWLGPAGTVSHAHCDYSDNFLVQIFGKKTLALYAPDEARFLHTVEGAPSFMKDARRAAPRMLVAEVNPDAPDIERFPNYKGAHRLDCEIGPGDSLFIPSCWFHHVRSLTTSLSVNFFAAEEDLPSAAIS